MKMIEKFIQHPEEVNMTYFEHLVFALKLAFRLILMGCCSIIHSFFPFLFTKYSSSNIRDLNNLFNQRYHEGDN